MPSGYSTTSARCCGAGSPKLHRLGLDRLSWAAQVTVMGSARGRRARSPAAYVLGLHPYRNGEGVRHLLDSHADSLYALAVLGDVFIRLDDGRRVGIDASGSRDDDDVLALIIRVEV